MSGHKAKNDIPDVIKMLLSPEHANWLAGVAATALHAEHSKVEAIRAAFHEDIGAGDFSRRVGEILKEQEPKPVVTHTVMTEFGPVHVTSETDLVEALDALKGAKP
jgi:hypothetical protein